MALEIPTFIKKPNAIAIRNMIDGWFTASWPYRERRAKVETYANGGPPPQKNPKKDPQVTPLGLAKSAMTKARDALTDTFDQKPGPVYLKYKNQTDPDRASFVESHVNVEFNKIILEFVDQYTLAAGSATLSGSCNWYRTSPNDVQWTTDDIYFPLDAPINPRDRKWREWALLSEFDIATLEELIHNAKDEDDGEGWSKSALEQLKLYIMASEYQKRGNEFAKVWGEFDRAKWLAVNLSDFVRNNPISVAWYFKKNGTYTEDKDDTKYYCDEKIDLMCISRYGVVQPIKTQDFSRWMETSYTGMKGTDFAEMLGQQILRPEVPEVPDGILLFRKQNAFRSVNECLIVHTDDDRVAGHASLLEVRGPGKNTMPRLSIMEGLLSAMLKGLTVAATPHWQEVRAGVDIAKIRAMEQGVGLPANGVIPDGLQPAAKNNSFAGIGQGLEMVRVMDGSMAGETATAPTFGSQQAEFQAQAEAQLSEAARIALRRFRKWLRSLDRLFDAQAQTLMRPFKEWKSWMPGFRPAMQFHNCLQNKYGIQPEELEYINYEVSARRLAGELQGQAAIQKASQFIQLFGAIFPKAVPVLAREAFRAEYGDVWVATVLGPAPKDMTPVQTATANALANGVVPALDPSVPGIDYVEFGLLLSGKQLELHMQQGEISQKDRWGMVALLQLTKNAAMTLPEQIAEPAINQIDQMAKALGKIPVTPSVAQQEKSIEEKKLELAAANQQRLVQQGVEKRQKDLDASLLKRRQLLGQEAESRARQDNINTQTAATMQKMAMDEIKLQNPEIENPPPSAE